jgi:hypothetical protein
MRLTSVLDSNEAATDSWGRQHSRLSSTHPFSWPVLQFAIAWTTLLRMYESHSFPESRTKSDKGSSPINVSSFGPFFKSSLSSVNIIIQYIKM